jgi:large subunit ribosomal protein L22
MSDTEKAATGSSRAATAGSRAGAKAASGAPKKGPAGVKPAVVSAVPAGPVKTVREPGSKPPQKVRPPRKITTGYRANVPFQRVSATKVRRIADNVRRKPYVEAIALLDVLPHKGARLLRKLIQSAAANALAQNKNLDEGMLYVKELLIDVGPSMKRMWARGRGRADRLIKRSCHISVVVDEIGAKEVGNGSEG